MTNYDFLAEKYDREKWKELIRSLFPAQADVFAREERIPMDNERIESFVQFGTVRLNDQYDTQLALFEIRLKPGTTKLQINRVALNKIVSKINENALLTGALAVYVDDEKEKWRFSFIATKHQYTHSGEFEKWETEPKRYTYLFGRGEHIITAQQRFKKLEGKSSIHLSDLIEAFSVEKISDEFFIKYKKHYERFRDELYENPIAKSIFENDQKAIRDFVKKLIGRLVFLYFLQKKGWLGAKDTKEYFKGEPDFVAKLFGDRNTDKSKFHSKELKKLFYHTLNERRKDDEYQAPWGKVCVPYLNGGLFDNDLPAANDLDFSPELFEDLFKFFGEYNFTVDESSPNDHQVGIDPEMLGHIFENLLEENRSKGAIYTPKAIVHFMCQQSLSEWLKRQFKSIPAEQIDRLVEKKDVKGIPLKLLEEILVKLNNIRICDPAIGSGAFPMGLLQEIYSIKEAIYLDAKGLKVVEPAKLKSEIIQSSIYGVDLDAGAVDIARLRFWLAIVVDEENPTELPNLDYKIMQGNSLLESFEDVDLSRMTDVDDEDDVIFANKNQLELGAEFSKTKQTVILYDSIKKEKLFDKIDDFFSEKDREKKEFLKLEITQIIDGRIHHEILQNQRDKESRLSSLEKTFKAVGGDDFIKKFEGSKNKDFKTYLKLKEEMDEIAAKEKRLLDYQHGDDRPFFLWRLYFHKVFKEGGFDIVIANPPYMRVQEIEKSFPREKKQYEETLTNGKKRFEVTKGAYDLANLFFEFSIKRLSKPNAVNCFIFPHKFFNADSGEAFRDYLMEGRYIDKIAHFGANRVFNDVDTYVCIALFSPLKNEGFYLQKFPYGVPFLDKLYDNSLYKFIPYTELVKAAKLHGSNQWIFFQTQPEYDSFEKIYKESKKFSEVFDDIFQGIATSNDKLYLVDVEDENDEFIYGENQVAEKKWKLEKELFKPMLKGKDVQRYSPLQTQTHVFFPYEIVTNKKGERKAEVISLETLEKEYPCTYAFVKEQEKDFKARESGKAGKMEYWYEYIYPKNLVKFDQRKLSSMEICTTHPNVSLNENNLYHNTKVYSWVKKVGIQESYEYLLAIANSSLLWWFLKNTGDTLQGDARTLKTNYLNPFPIPKEVSKAKEEAIANLVKCIIWLNAGNSTGLPLSNDAIEQYFRQVVDACVCELYFEDEMVEKDIHLLKYVIEDLNKILQNTINGNSISNLFRHWQSSNSEVRNRLKLISVRSADKIGLILSSTQSTKK